MGNLKPIIIYGIGQQADLVHYYFEKILSRQVLAFTIDMEIKYDKKNSLPVIPFNQVTHYVKNTEFEFFVAVGGIALNLIREYYFKQCKKTRHTLANCITLTSTSHLTYGNNTLIDSTTRVMPFVHMGDNACVMGGNIGHHVKIGDHVSIISSTIGGNVTIGNNCFISLNATIHPGITIGEYSLIDTGAIITKDIPAYTVATRDVPTGRKIDSRRVKLLGESYNSFLKKILLKKKSCN